MRSFLILSSAVALMAGCATTSHVKVIGDSEMMLERRNYANVSPPVGLYVHAVKSGRYLFVSGITAFGSPVETGGTVEHYQGSYPASSLVRVAGLFAPNLKVEVEAVLVLRTED